MNNVKLLFKKESYELLTPEKDSLNNTFVEYLELIEKQPENYFDIFRNSILDEKENEKFINGFIFLSIHEDSKISQIESCYNFFIKNNSRNLTLLFNNLLFLYQNLSDINTEFSFKFLKIIKISFFDIIKFNDSEKLMITILRTLSFNNINELSYLNYFEFFNFLYTNYESIFPNFNPNLIILIFCKIIKFLGLVQLSDLFNEFKQILITLSQKLLQDYFQLFQTSGIDLFLLLQNLVKNPIFQYLNQIFVKKDSVVQIKDPDLKYNIITLNITPKVEELILYFLLKGNKQTFNYQLNWILTEINFQSDSLSELYIVDIIRYIICNTKDLYSESDQWRIRRWIVIGWFLNCMKSVSLRTLGKQSIFADWIFFRNDDFQELESHFIPLLELIYFSADKYPLLSNELIEFLKNYAEEFGANNQISFILNTIFDKKPEMKVFFLTNNNLDPVLQTYIKNMTKKKTFLSDFVIQPKKTLQTDFSDLFKHSLSDKQENSSFSNFDWEIFHKFQLFENLTVNKIQSELFKTISNKDNFPQFQNKNISVAETTNCFFSLIQKLTSSFITIDKNNYDQKLILKKNYDIKQSLLYYFFELSVFYFKNDLKAYEVFEIFLGHVLKINDSYITDFLISCYFFEKINSQEKTIEEIIVRILSYNKNKTSEAFEKIVKWSFFSFLDDQFFEMFDFLVRVSQKIQDEIVALMGKYFFKLFNVFEKENRKNIAKNNIVNFFLTNPKFFFIGKISTLENLNYLQFFLEKLIKKKIDNFEEIIFCQVLSLNLNFELCDEIEKILELIFRVILDSNNEVI